MAENIHVPIRRLLAQPKIATTCASPNANFDDSTGTTAQSPAVAPHRLPGRVRPHLGATASLCANLAEEHRLEIHLRTTDGGERGRAQNVFWPTPLTRNEHPCRCRNKSGMRILWLIHSRARVSTERDLTQLGHLACQAHRHNAKRRRVDVTIT